MPGWPIERTKLAIYGTYIGVVDIAIYKVSHFVPRDSLSS